MIAGSLFSGVGGLDLGLARAGYQHAFFAEVDPWRRDVLAAHWPGTTTYPDVRDVARGERIMGDVDLLAGGFPCQDLSVAGKRAGLAGARSGLFYEALRVADTLRPTWVLLENVPGLANSQEGRDFAIVVDSLAGWPEALTLYGESDDHIRGAIQSSRSQTSATIRECDGLLGLWTFGREDGAAPPGHPEPPRGSGRALHEMPHEAQPETCPTSGLRRVRFYLPTEAAKASAVLLGPMHRGEQSPFGDPSLGVHASLRGWTAPEGIKAPDSRRYAACGDGVVSNVSEWIGRRIMAAA